MNFVNPFLLLFAAAAGIPLLLHLLNRQRVKVIEFSTIKYLLSLQKTRMRKVKVRQILLLILRTLALLAIAIAFARPTSQGGYLPSLGGKATTTAIIMIDISGSSMSETNSGSFFEKNIQKATQLLGDLTQKEKIEIIAFGSSIIYDSGEPTSEFDRLKSFLKSIQPSYSTSAPQLAFAKAHEVLKKSTDPNLELYLISDFQGEAWKNFEFSLFEQEKLGVKLFLVRTSGDAVDNVALEQVRFPNQLITAGRGFELQAQAKNYKTDGSADLLFSLDVNDKRVAQTDLTIVPSGSGKVSFTQSAPSSSFLFGDVMIDDDDLLPDNKYHFAMRIPSSSKILLISDNDQETFYIQKALSPGESQTFTKQVDVVGTLQSATTNFLSYDAVIVDVKGQLAASASSGLKSFINAGGAALFMMPPSLDMRDFSDKISSPLFGLQIVEAPPAITTATGKYLLNKYNFDHPLFSPYKQFTADKLPQAEFLGHFKTLESASSTVLARFSDNTPAVLEASLGKGKAMLLTFSLDRRYSDLVERPFMVILMNRSIEYLVAEPLNQRESLEAGNEMTREIGTQSAKEFSLINPGNDTTQLSPTFRTGSVLFNLGRLQRPGIYKIIGDSKIVDVFAVNFPAKESEPTYAKAEDVGKKITGTKVIVLDYDSDPNSVIASARYGTELWKLFLFIGFVLLMTEMAVAYGGKQPEVSTS